MIRRNLEFYVIGARIIYILTEFPNQNAIIIFVINVFKRNFKEESFNKNAFMKNVDHRLTQNKKWQNFRNSNIKINSFQAISSLPTK